MGDERRIGQYQLGDIIGKGAAGSVYRGLNLRTGEVVAIKQIRKEGFSSNDEIEAARKEIDVLRDLHHRNIVKYIGYEQTEQELDIILEYCEGGSLQNILRKFSKFPENLVGVYVAQILDGLSYLHNNAILHRDIKPGNILLLKDGVVKLADFGVARFQNGLNTVVGSPYWIAPEVLQLKGATAASDIWSLGCTIVQLVDGKAPYQDLPPMAAMFRIGQDEHPPFPPNISVQLRDFLSKCLVHVPSARATAAELRSHEWIFACLREREGEGQPQDNYEQDIRAVAQWNLVLQNSSPRDVKRFSIHGNGHLDLGSSKGSGSSTNNGCRHSQYYPSHHNHNQSNSSSYNNLNNSISNLNHSYSSSRTRDDIAGAISGMSSMGIPNSNENTARRTVSSIAAYEEDSGDDWDNAFQNLDALQLKTKPRLGMVYPQSIAAPMSPAIRPRKHSLSTMSDAQDSEPVSCMPALAERAVSDPASGLAASNMQMRPHTSPPSPRMYALKKNRAGPEYEHMDHPTEYDDDGTASSNENPYPSSVPYIDNGARMSATSLYYASASDVRLDAMNDGVVASNAILTAPSKRPSLGLRQDIHHISSNHLAHSSLADLHDSGHIGIDTPNMSCENLSGYYQHQHQHQQSSYHYQLQQGQLSRQQQKQQKALQSRPRNNETREIVHPGFPSRSSEERLRRETEIRWIQDIGNVVTQLRNTSQEEAIIYQCQQLVALLKDGRGVFSISQDWRVRSIIDAIRLHQANGNALKHLLMLINRLCHMDNRYTRIFCLHGILPLILPILERQQSPFSSGGDPQSEAASFVNRLCRSEDPAPIQMLLACDGISSLCIATSALVELDVAVAANQISRVITSLISLIITKAMPAELTASDIGDLLLQSRISLILSLLFSKYGEACQLPSSGHSSVAGSDAGHSQPSPADRVYHAVCEVLMVASRLFNELVRRIDSLQEQMCESGMLASIFAHLHRYPRKAVVLIIHGVRYLSKNPLSLDVLDNAGVFSVCVSLLRSPSARAYREYVMTTVLRLCSSSSERQKIMATQYPLLVTTAMEYAQLREAPTLSKCGRLIILGLASGGAQCCRVLKEANAFELVVKLISRERWCGMAIRALLEWTRTAPSDIVPSLTNEHHSAEGWSELARPLLNLSTSSTTLDMYAATFYSLVRLRVPAFPRACMGTGEANSDCLWVMLMDRYLNCSGLGSRESASVHLQGISDDLQANGYNGTGGHSAVGATAARPEVVAANRMNATTRLTFLNLLLVLQPHLRITNSEVQRRISHYYTEMVISSKLDPALPVRKASLELSLALERM
ncbi:Protein kinase of the Mitotic Exit Network [Coemansia sp. RSA 1358]|uniref:Protein kinase of the Mitotic Exit Network n=1 Tax=Coemansia umbellata TaxID=1424467 RepID=A0ABQ8PUH1_9FUNG|nr:Protein kinase of the Mitotic Exit Network [Coemansia umbellata]KAJ2624640.1 Protein kinase of the Mitotic Exit Network [Coemansia sp. RSA 1358]